MRHLNRRAPRWTEPQGTVLVTCLLLLLFVSFLGGLLLVLGRSETTISTNSRASMQAWDAAEYGLELAVSGVDPAQPATAFADQTLAPGASVTAGLRDRSNASPVNYGLAPCPSGYSLSLSCSGYTFAATGWARGWISVTASTQVEEAAAIYRGCNGTEYSC